MKRRIQFFRRWQNWLGLLLVALFLFLAIAAPVLSPVDMKNPGTIKIVGNPRDFQPRPPSVEAPLGTLSKGISVYHSLIWGTRSALVFGLVVALFSMFLGVLVGLLSGYKGGFLNDALMRVSDTFMSFPLIAGVVLISQLFTIILNNAGVVYMTMAGYISTNSITSVYIPENLPAWLVTLQKIDPVIIAFILFSWMPYARLMNTTILRLKNTEYIEAAHSLGARPSRVIFRHLLPNALSPAIVMAAKDVGGMVLLQATFTFIGMGSSSPWGMLLVNGRDWILSPGGIFTYWWVFVPPTIALILFGIAWNLLGDGLNDALNPRTTL
jgi:peptide/nickel transport system permease protein